MKEDHHLFPGEPRALADGRTVLLATFTCGFYRVTDIDGPSPRVEFLRAFGGHELRRAGARGLALDPDGARRARAGGTRRQRPGPIPARSAG